MTMRMFTTVVLMAVALTGQSLQYPGGWVQSFAGPDGAARNARITDYQEGLRALDAQEWRVAAAAFTKVAERKGAAADGALYWKAYAQSRDGDRQSALTTLAELRRAMPNSRWLRDAAALDAEIQGSGAQPVSLSAPDTNVKLLAINGLMLSKPALAVPALKNVLLNSNPAAVKDRALFVLAQSSSAEAHQAVTDIARSGQDIKLRVRAIRYVGMLGGDDAPNQLLSIYRADGNESAKRAALQGLALSHSHHLLIETAKTEKSPALRAEAIRQLAATDGNFSGDLTALFRREESSEVRTAILQTLASCRNAKALAELALGEEDTGRKAEIMRYLLTIPSDDASGYPVRVLK